MVSNEVLERLRIEQELIKYGEAVVVQGDSTIKLNDQEAKLTQLKGRQAPSHVGRKEAEGFERLKNNSYTVKRRE